MANEDAARGEAIALRQKGRSSWAALSLVAAVIGFVAAFVALHFFVRSSLVQTDLQDLALGPETKSHYASIDGVRVHCSDLSDAQLCIDGLNARGAGKAVLWLGNSQLHGINQMKVDDKSAPELLTAMLGDMGRTLVTFSEPNANLQEHLLLFTYLGQRITLEGLVLPVVFDDLRETGIRDELTGMLDDPATSQILADTEIGRRIIASAASQDAGEHGDQNLQAIVERKLEAGLAAASDVWRSRADLRSNIYVALFRLRNAVMGISPSSVRRSIPGRYAMNMAALDAILRQAADRKIPILVYVPPLRNDVQIPYAVSEYEKFKQDLAAKVAGVEGARFADFENVVPASFWGTKSGTSIGVEREVDFMHFQAGGHHLFAEALLPNVTSILSNGAD